MAAHTEDRVLPYTPAEIFALVADVESYPDFLPLWKTARIYRRENSVYYTHQVVQIGPARKSFRSWTKLSPHSRIQIGSSDPLFRHFAIEWDFAEAPGGVCHVRFSLSCEAKSRLLQKVFDLVLLDAARNIVSAFEQRAQQLYGPKQRPPG